MGNINVINKAEKDLNVTINNVNGDIQIIINTNESDINLLSLKSGEIFSINDVEYIVLEQFSGNKTAVLRKELLENNMKFGDNNNWKTSDVRRKLNGEYLREIEEAFGEDRIVEHTVDLLSLDGLDDYGTSTDKVSLLTIDQYRKYRKILGDNMKYPWWLVTPDSTPPGYPSRYVQCVNSHGYVRGSGNGYDGGSASVFYRSILRCERLYNLKSLNLV